MRNPSIAGRPNIESAKLPDRVAIPDVQLTGLPRILLVLRNGTDGIELKNAVIPTDRSVPFNDTMRGNGGASTYFDVGSNDAVRPHRHGAIELRIGVNNGSRMDLRHN
jgi:hypothetical protein